MLELCCGTGGQTELLAKQLYEGELICSDINPESIEKNKLRLNCPRISYIITDIDSLPEELDGGFDVIFCGYGFYYGSSNADFLLERLLPRLASNGQFILVGPILGNNAELYELLNELKIKIPGDVLNSSEEFMLNMNRKFLRSFESVKLRRVKNSVTFGSAGALLNYWKKTTFYQPGSDEDFIKVAPRIFGNEFNLTKSIALLEGKCVDV